MKHCMHPAYWYIKLEMRRLFQNIIENNRGCGESGNNQNEMWKNQRNGGHVQRAQHLALQSHAY